MREIIARRGIYWFLALLIACNASDNGPTTSQEAATDDIEAEEISLRDDSLTVTPTTPADSAADVIAISATGSETNYLFSVTVSSPDEGCGQYADWWEVLGAEGNLLYRRVLLHSHVSEQPFARSGGPVPIAADQVVWVRAHMHPQGYGGTAFKGTVRDGFQLAALAPDFAAAVADQSPLPEDCDF